MIRTSLIGNTLYTETIIRAYKASNDDLIRMVCSIVTIV